MRVPRPHPLTARLIGAFMLGAGVLLCPQAPLAAEGPTRPPAEYKPLPVGTWVKYDKGEFTGRFLIPTPRIAKQPGLENHELL